MNRDLGTSPTGPSTSAKPQFFHEGKPVRLQWFRAPSAGLSPTILLLHGASGVSHGNGQMRRIAEHLCAHGYSTCLVHYFDRTDTTFAGDPAIAEHYETWVQTIQAAVDFVCEDPEIDPNRIALFGYSLGAYLAITAAARDARIGAVVELAGGIDSDSALHVHRFPPVLILHGSEDRRVPVQEAVTLQNLLKQLGAAHEVQIFPGEGHILSLSSSTESINHALAFLDLHLQTLPGKEDDAMLIHD